MSLTRWRQPLVVSVALHAIVLSSFSLDLAPFRGRFAELGNGASLKVRIVPESVSANAPPLGMRPSEVGPSRRGPARLAAKDRGRAEPSRTLTSSAPPSKEALVQPLRPSNENQGGALSPDDELRYRLSLARALRAERRGSSGFRQAPRAGQVELLITQHAGGRAPEVLVGHSSGEKALDGEALAMLSAMVQRVPLPAGSQRLSVALLFEAAEIE